MSKGNSNQEIKSNELNTVLCTDYEILKPLQMEWQPKEDITTYELALCLQFLHRQKVMPYEVDKSLPHFRHFKITDPN